MDKRIFLEKPNFDKIPGGFEDFNKDKLLNYYLEDAYDEDLNILDVYPEVAIINNFLTKTNILELKNYMETFPNPENVSVSGMMNSEIFDRIGSVRNTVYSKRLSLEFNKKFKHVLENNILETDDKFPSDIWQNVKGSHKWKFEGVSPMFRFMTYKSGGEHVPHYDASYIYNFDNSYRTLYSFVLCKIIIKGLNNVLNFYKKYYF